MNEVLSAIHEHASEMKEFKSKIKEDYGWLRDAVVELSQKSYGKLIDVPNSYSRAGDIGAQFAQFDGLKLLKEGANSTGFFEVKAPVTSLLETKNTVTNANANPFTDQFRNVLGEDPRHKLSLLEALPRVQVNNQSIEFQRLDNYSNAAAVQLNEGDLKAEGALPMAVERAYIETVAHYFKATEQVLADSPLVAMQINNLLRYGVMQKAEDLLLNAAGGIGRMKGLLASATAGTPTATLSPIDRIGEAAAKLDSIGWNPSHVVMSRLDYFKMVSERDDNGRYVSATPFDPVRNTVWGLQIVISHAMAAGNALVFDASQTVILDRESVRVEAARVNDEFVRNILTIRGEMRISVATFSESALIKFALS